MDEYNPNLINLINQFNLNQHVIQSNNEDYILDFPIKICKLNSNFCDFENKFYASEIEYIEYYLSLEMDQRDWNNLNSILKNCLPNLKCICLLFENLCIDEIENL